MRRRSGDGTSLSCRTSRSAERRDLRARSDDQDWILGRIQPGKNRTHRAVGNGDAACSRLPIADMKEDPTSGAGVRGLVGSPDPAITARDPSLGKVVAQNGHEVVLTSVGLKSLHVLPVGAPGDGGVLEDVVGCWDPGVVRPRIVAIDTAVGQLRAGIGTATKGAHDVESAGRSRARPLPSLSSGCQAAVAEEGRGGSMHPGPGVSGPLVGTEGGCCRPPGRCRHDDDLAGIAEVGEACGGGGRCCPRWDRESYGDEGEDQAGEDRWEGSCRTHAVTVRRTVPPARQHGRPHASAVRVGHPERRTYWTTGCPAPCQPEMPDSSS